MIAVFFASELGFVLPTYAIVMHIHASIVQLQHLVPSDDCRKSSSKHIHDYQSQPHAMSAYNKMVSWQNGKMIAFSSTQQRECHGKGHDCLK